MATSSCVGRRGATERCLNDPNYTVVTAAFIDFRAQAKTVHGGPATALANLLQTMTVHILITYSVRVVVGR